jgi:hypothetical protein
MLLPTDRQARGEARGTLLAPAGAALRTPALEEDRQDRHLTGYLAGEIDRPMMLAEATRNRPPQHGSFSSRRGGENGD